MKYIPSQINEVQWKQLCLRLKITVLFFSLLLSSALDVLFKVRTWTSTQYTKRLTKRDYFEPQQLSSTATKAVSRGNWRTSKLSFLVHFTISSYMWAKILMTALLGIFFSFSFVVSTSQLILACPTGCLEMLQFLLLFFCLYCNFILNVTSSKTSFASEARNTQKRLFKQLHKVYRAASYTPFPLLHPKSAGKSP